MKKYLLGLLVLGFTFIGFSNASSQTFTPAGNYAYNPQYIYLEDNICESLSVSNFTCNSDDFCFLTMNETEESDQSSNINIQRFIEDVNEETESDGIQVQCEVGEYEGLKEYIVYYNDDLQKFNSLTLTWDGNFEIGGGESGGGESGGGESGGGSIGSLLPGGKEALSGAVSGLTSTVNEFIPLMVYIGLGVLGAVIGFFAIKYLIGWIRKNVFNSFK